MAQFPFHFRLKTLGLLKLCSAFFVTAYDKAEVGTNNFLSKAQHKMSNLIFCISEAQRNLRNEFFDSVEVQNNSPIAE